MLFINMVCLTVGLAYFMGENSMIRGTVLKMNITDY
jgi:hypothetical protein